MTWIDEFRNASPDSRQPLLATAPGDAAAHIQSQLLALLYSDLAAAEFWKDAGCHLAALRPEDREARAYAERGCGHVAYVKGIYDEAVAHYRSAMKLFGEVGKPGERARTQSSGIQSLILLSGYEEARQWVAEAEQVFLQAGDLLRLARLDTNAGNIDFRQDRARDAVIRYRRALDGFRQAGGDPKDIAATLSNLAVAHTNLGEFPLALEAYAEAREHSRRHGLAPLVARADYNIAYLHFLRGDYAEARRLYEESRQQCEASGDAYHLALCDLDEAEMSLELNLTEEGEALARRAVSRFDELGLRYERAKAFVSLAVAISQRGESLESDKILRHARELFLKENNEVWPALIDLFRAVLAFRSGREQAARKLSTAAWKTLAHTRLPGRAALCQILRGRLWLREGYADRARATSREALAALGDDAPPSPRFHAKLLEGEAEEFSGRWAEAESCYEAARHELEDLRGRLDTEDLRISILKDKLSVYEGLVSLHLESPLALRPGSIDQAWLLVQQAKSRSLADRLLNIGGSMAAGQDAMIDSLRRDLNWCYRQIEWATLMDRTGHPSAPVSELKSKARNIEAELMRIRPVRRDEPALGSGTSELADADALRAAIPPDTALLEYFESRGRLYLFLSSRTETELVRLGASNAVRHALKLLQFQMGKYRTHPGDARLLSGLPASLHHLQTLQNALLEPVCSKLRRYSKWIVAPHRYLHAAPFAALQREGVCAYDVVEELYYTPSASVFAACERRPAAQSTGGNWVIAAPDVRNPDIGREADDVARLLSACKRGSNLAAFHQAAAGCSILHLAAHSVFRRDNPMFSSLQLSDGRLSLYDIARTQIDARLVTLSGCSTGRAVPVAGDELLGLMRGFLTAGARNLLVSLWEVHDESTADFMRLFYKRLSTGDRPGVALRHATAEIRREREHPYYWAPFLLVGGSVW